MSLQQFWDQLNQHDWFYEFSDDHQVWLCGSGEASRLYKISKQSPEHEKLFNDFSKHHFSGKPWGTEKQAKPARPE